MYHAHTHTHTHTHIYIYMYVYHQVILLARIPPSLSLSLSLSTRPHCLSSPVGPLNYILCLCRAVVGKSSPSYPRRHICLKETIGERHSWFRPCFSSGILHVLVVFQLGLEIGGKWQYSCCFVGWCFQKLFNITCAILEQFSSCFSLCRSRCGASIE